MTQPTSPGEWRSEAELVGERADELPEPEPQTFQGSEEERQELMAMLARLNAEEEQIGDKREGDSWRLIPLKGIKPRGVEWLWEHRIATGTLTLLAGPGGVGKGTLWVDLVAQATRGELAGDLLGEPVSCLILTAEERLSDVVVPRLTAAGADLERTTVLEMRSEGYGRDATFPDDVEELRAALAWTGARLVIIDPLNAHLADRIDSHKDAPLRRALGPLTRIAGESGAAVLAIAHVGKGAGGDAVSRILGSVGYVNAARSVLVMGVPPDAWEGLDRVVAMPKSNYSAPVPSLRVRLAGRHTYGLLPDGSEGEIETVGLEWLGEDATSAEDLLGSLEDRSALGEAVDWLRDTLSDRQGSPLPEGLPRLEIARQARAEDIREATLKRAQKQLGVIITRDDSRQGRPSIWRLPPYSSTPDRANPLSHKKPNNDGGSSDYGSHTLSEPKPSHDSPLEAAEKLVVDLLGGGVVTEAEERRLRAIELRDSGMSITEIRQAMARGLPPVEEPPPAEQEEL